MNASSSIKAVKALDHSIARIRRYGNSDTCPNTAKALITRLNNQLYEFVDTAEPKLGRSVLITFGQLESVFARSASAVDSGLIPVGKNYDPTHAKTDLLTPWVEAVGEISAEFLVAVALASLRNQHGRALKSEPLDFRDYVHGTIFNAKRTRVYDPHATSKVPRLVEALEQLAAVHLRRHIDAIKVDARVKNATSTTETDKDKRDYTLNFQYGIALPVNLIEGVLAESFDFDYVLKLAKGLTLLSYQPRNKVLMSWLSNAKSQVRVASGGSSAALYQTLALAWHGHTDPGISACSKDILTARPGWAAKLNSGAVNEVARDALLRLTMAGFKPRVTVEDLLLGVKVDSRLGKRLLAALLIRPEQLRGSLTLIAKKAIKKSADGGNYEVVDLLQQEDKETS